MAKARDITITPDFLKTILSYDPQNGLFKWLPRQVANRYDKAFNTSHAGNAAGKVVNGYLTITYRGCGMLAHRIAVAMMTGEWPVVENDVDHIDGNRLNNSWANLREVSKGTNRQNGNCHAARRISTYKGVQRRGNKFTAVINHQGKVHRLGRFVTEWEAASAYNTAATKMFGEHAYQNSRAP